MTKPKKYNEQTGIVIRGIKTETIELFDKQAEELGNRLNRKISRQEYIRMVLEGNQARPIYELQKELIHETIDRFSAVMEQQIDTFNTYIERNEMILELMTGISIEQLGKDELND